jgi:hypothetical protein
MAGKSKLNWKVLDPLVLVLEKEGWSLAMIAEDWGIALATLEAHLTQEVPIVKKTDVNWERFDELKAQGLPMIRISEAMGIPRTTLGPLAKQRANAVQTPVEPMSTGAEYSAEQSVDTGADELFDEQDTQEQRPVHTPVHDSIPSLDTSVENGADDSADESQVLFLPPEPVQTAVQRFDTGPVQTLDTGAVQRLDQLEEDVRNLAHMMRSVMDRLNHTPVQTPVQITTTPPYPRGRSIRWNLWILEPIRDEIATLAAKQDLSPSQLVQELLWKALRQE